MNIKKLFKIFYLKIKNIFAVNHKKNPICLNNSSITYDLIPFVNTTEFKFWNIEKQNAELISYNGKSDKSSTNYPMIESWLKINNTTLTPNNHFINEQLNLIQKNINNKKLFINDDLFVMPYYTSVFGHFVGDLLGSLLFFLNNIKKESKLFLYTPSNYWDKFFREEFGNQVYLLNPNEIFNKNIIFKNCMVLPRMNTVQNYILAKNYMYNRIKNLNEEKNLFLSSGRLSRIANIEDVENYFREKKFEVVDPSKLPIIECLSKIKNANILVSEKASILNNIHLVRDKKYFILSSGHERTNSKKSFTYAGIYKSLNEGISEDIICDDDPKIQKVKPFKKRIRVNLNDLNKIIFKD
ncbi:glycosyltransferase family 61 protein [Candidatus Pelagibacter sp.]|nr:glycosyltransferase family 61 protein [Candidatus Pelagibacter sp.]